MARSAISPVQPGGSYAAVATSAVWVAADAANGNSVVKTERDLLFIRNNGAVTRTVTIRSSADPFNRTSDLAISLVAGQQVVVGPLTLTGWAQSDGKLWVDASHADVQLVVIALP